MDPGKIYEFDEESLTYKEISRSTITKRSDFVSYFLLLLLTLLIFIFSNIQENIDDYSFDDVVVSYSIGSDPWRDSIFNEYEIRASLYLINFPNTPIKPNMLRLAAYNVYDSIGIIVPVELALAQAQIESCMGTKGRSPKNNPYNIGEWDNKTVTWMDSTYDGIESYYFLISNQYLKCKSISDLFVDFSNCNGYRYASNLDYENLIRFQYSYIKRVIDKRLTGLEDCNT